MNMRRPVRVRPAIIVALIAAYLLPFAPRVQAQTTDDGSGRPARGPAVVSPAADSRGVGVPTWLDEQAFRWSARGTDSPIRRSVARLDTRTLALRNSTEPSNAQYGRRYGRHRNSGAIGLALGALGGFVAGGLIGSEVTTRSSCNCSDPQLHGFLIGGGIGAVVGGFLGYAIAR